MPDPVLTGASDPPPAGWTGRERLAIVALLLALVGLAALRMGTRRADAARNPLDLDVLVLHVAGLSADAATAEELARDLRFDPADMQVWSNAFAQGTDPTRSARCALAGDLVRDLSDPPTDRDLPVRLGAEGWRTLLVDDSGALSAQVGDGFSVVTPIERAEDAAPAVAAHWQTGDPAPRFAFVHLGFGHEPLHADTTEAHVLAERYRLRLRRVREAIRSVAAAAETERPQLVVLLGAAGLERGEHPEAPELPWDAQLHVPLLMGLRNAAGMPPGAFATLVQGADLAPTVLDVLDLRPRPERADVSRAGISLEPHLHGWNPAPVHEDIALFGTAHVAVRSPRWKLIAPIDPPLRPRQEGSRLYALSEDPGEQNDLLADGEFGPVAERLFERLRWRFGAPGPRDPENTAQAP